MQKDILHQGTAETTPFNIARAMVISGLVCTVLLLAVLFMHTPNALQIVFELFMYYTFAVTMASPLLVWYMYHITRRNKVWLYLLCPMVSVLFAGMFVYVLTHPKPRWK
jgi:hypothetical protein